MITFDEFKLIFDLKNYCGEILFSINDSTKYNSCWMGKYLNKNTEKAVYWFGLTQDGKNAFEFSTFEEFSSAKVFDEKSLFEIWANVTLLEINACDASKMLEIYLA